MGIAERREREKEQRRNNIIDAAERVFFSKGIENATMDEVANEAELSKGTLYLYFKNKDELLHGIMGRSLNMMYNMFKKAVKKEKTGLDKIEAIGKAYYEFYKKAPKYFELMLHKEGQKTDLEKMKNNPNYAHCEELGNEIFALMREAVAIGINDGTIRDDLDPDRLPLILWGHSAGVLQIVKAKEQVMNSFLNIEPESVIEYSRQLIMSYLKK